LFLQYALIQIGCILPECEAHLRSPCAYADTIFHKETYLQRQEGNCYCGSGLLVARIQPPAHIEGVTQGPSTSHHTHGSTAGCPCQPASTSVPARSASCPPPRAKNNLAGWLDPAAAACASTCIARARHGTARRGAAAPKKSRPFPPPTRRAIGLAAAVRSDRIAAPRAAVAPRRAAGV
jgi:hypothetical protein